tara:strand:- start:54 stop:635 length:582 start_codon:yes stop_codon:yes gene_type:complete
MIEVPFWNDFFSLISPENRNEIIEHCMNPELELPKQDFEWGEQCLSEKVYLKLTGFTELLKPYLIEVLSEVIDGDIPYGFSVDEVWKNTYHRYYHQEQHDHRGFELSFVIFMNDYQENDAQFYFVNERCRLTAESWGDISALMPDTIPIEGKKGDIVFFPSHMLHGVSPHQSDNTRITVSGNVTIRDLRQETV